MPKEKTQVRSVRLKHTEIRTLENEAKSEFMTLAGYLRKLVITHPERKKR